MAKGNGMTRRELFEQLFPRAAKTRHGMEVYYTPNEYEAAWDAWNEQQAEIERNRAAIAELVGLMKDYIEAADNSMNPPDGDDIAAMIIFAEADKAARFAITKYDTPTTTTTKGSK